RRGGAPHPRSRCSRCSPGGTATAVAPCAGSRRRSRRTRRTASPGSSRARSTPGSRPAGCAPTCEPRRAGSGRFDRNTTCGRPRGRPHPRAVPGGHMSVVVAHLSTPEGREALDSAATEAVRRGTELVVVVTESSSATPELVAAHEDDLRRVEERLAGTGATLRREQGTSDLADDLVSAAERASAELIVIGLRRRSPVGKLILGSNAQRILLDAPCPVLAVKPERAARS